MRSRRGRGLVTRFRGGLFASVRNHQLTFVDLPQINVLGVQAESCKQLGRGASRADAHLVWLDTHDASTDPLAQDLHSSLLRHVSSSHGQSDRTVADLGRVAGGTAAVSLEDGLELRHCLKRRVVSNAFVERDSLGRLLACLVHPPHFNGLNVLS